MATLNLADQICARLLLLRNTVYLIGFPKQSSACRQIQP